MKKIVLITALLLFAASSISIRAQESACVGLKNPTNFTMSGSHSEKWTGYIGTKPDNPYVSSTCNASGSSFSTTVQASQLESQTGSSQSCFGQSSQDVHGNTDYQRRFIIKGSGSDVLTNNNVNYLPPDTSFHRSIRLGSSCGGGEAEMLTYEMTVSAENALVTIWYAMSLYNALHSYAENPEFTIIVEKRVIDNNGNPAYDANGNELWSLAGGDTLCYIRASPNSSSNLGPFQQTGQNVYLNWNKVMINLYGLLYQKIRIKIATCDCCYTAHYGYCYFAGECQPMALAANGCAAGESNAVALIKAPKGASNYQWYRSKTGVLQGEARESDASYVLISNENDDSLNCVNEHFVRVDNGQTVTQTTIMCKMTTQMNENYPIVSRIFTDVGNTKPSMVVDSILDCNAGITLTDLSFAPFSPADSNRVDTNATVWKFYTTDPPTDLSLAATYTGGTVHHTYATPSSATNHYSVKVRTSAFDSTCWNEKTISIRTVKRPTPRVFVERNNLCRGDTITIQDQTYGSGYHKWTLSNGITTIDTMTPMPVLQWVFDTTTTVKLVTRSATHYAADTTGDGIVEDVYCYSDTTFTIFVQDMPKLLVSGDTIVCNGDQSNVTVSCNNVPIESYNWYQVLNGTTPVVENNNQLVTNISADRRYYVKVTSTFGCISWDSIDLYLVNPSFIVLPDKICTGDTATLTAGRAAYFDWSSNPPDPALNAATYDSVVRVSPSVTTVYTVVGRGSNGCSATPLNQKVTVYPYPIMQVQLTPDYIDSENPSVQFADLSEYGASSLWNFGGGNTSTTRTVVFTFTDLSQDSILISLVTGNAIGCTSDTSFYVPVGIFAVWFPNAFTPRLETNNIFKPFTANTLEDYELHIYDRSGNLVFATTNVEEGWDGTYKGHDCKQGSYVYIATYRRNGVERLMSQKGTLTLIR